MRIEDRKKFKAGDWVAIGSIGPHGLEQGTCLSVRRSGEILVELYACSSQRGGFYYFPRERVFRHPASWEV